MKILYVDDQTVLVRSLIREFRAMGHEAEGFTSPEDALERIKEADFGIVISDLEMMSPMSGIDLYEKVIEEKPYMRGRFIVITGASRAKLQELINPLLDKPKVLQKPVSAKELIEAVEG